jgi:hypothetical protein
MLYCANRRGALSLAPVTRISLHSFKLKSQPRLALLMLCLFAYFSQNIVAQTHVHSRSGCSELMSAAPDCATGGETGKHKGGEPACPLCQVAMHGAAAALAPSAFIVPLVDRNSIAAVARLPLSFVAKISYHWRSRGPPAS